MAIADDFTIDYTNKEVEHTSGTTVYTLNALYSWLMDTFDELDQMDDPVPMSAQTPIDYSLINGWTLGAPTTDYQFLNGGTLTDTSDDTVWAGVYTAGTLVAGSQIYIMQNGSVLTSYWSTGHIEVLIKTKDAGSWIDSGDLSLFARETGDKYAVFDITATAGNTVGFLQTENDLDDDGTGSTVTGVVMGYVGGYTADVDDDGTDEDYDIDVDCGGNTVADTYLYLKYITEGGSTVQVDGADGDEYRAADPTYTEVPTSPFGIMAGGSFFGARGILMRNMAAADANKYQLIDADGNTMTPPVTVSLTIDKVVSGDRVSAFRLSGVGGTIITDEYTLDGLHAVSSTTVTVNEAIKADTPASGYIRVDGERLTYSAVDTTAKEFTTSATGIEHASGVDCYVPFIDAQATGTSIDNTIKYDADVPVLVRVRLKGIEPFEIEGTIASTGATISAIRNTDTIVT